MPRFDLSVIEEAEMQVAAEKQAAAEQADMNRIAAEQAVIDVKSAMDFLSKVVVAEQEVRTRPSVLARTKDAESFIHELRRHDNPVIRRAAWLEIIGYKLTCEVESPEKMAILINTMVDEGLLIPSEDGPIEAYGKHYAVNPDSLFGDSEVAEASKLVSQAVSIVRRKINSSACLEALDICGTRKIGTCVVFVPPQITVVTVEGKEEIKVRPGGKITLDVGIRTIRPIEVSGGIESVVRQAMDLGVVLPRASLNAEKLPLFEGESFEKGRKLKTLWYLLVRGIDFAGWCDEAKNEQEMIDEKQFFLQGMEGVCFVDVGVAWKWEEGGKVIWISQPVLRAKRIRHPDNSLTIEIKLPPHLRFFFFGNLNDESQKYPEGEKYSGLPLRLGALMRFYHGKVREQAAARAKYTHTTNGNGK